MRLNSTLRILAVIWVLVGLGFAQGPWGVATHLPAPVNSINTETNPVPSPDGNSLYFSCNGCNPGTGDDIYVTHRTAGGWTPPERLGANVASSSNDSMGAISPDGQRLFFVSDRAGGRGGSDLWVSRWDGNDWGAAQNLGDVNTGFSENTPTVFKDPNTGRLVMYFYSNRGLGTDDDIYVSYEQPDGTFGAAERVAELSTSSGDRALGVRADGLEIFLTSNRIGSIPNAATPPVASIDIWTSTRASIDDPWLTPVNVDPTIEIGTNPPLGLSRINSGRHDGSPKLSFDGRTLFFHAAQRHENFGLLDNCTRQLPTATCLLDLWIVTRPDTTPPNPPTGHVSPAPNAAGWNRTDVTVSFSSNGDAGPIFSGVKSCTSDVLLTSDTDGAEVSGTCTDNEGNISAPASVSVRLDETPPVVSVTGVSDGSSYLLGNVPSAGCDSYDGLSGLAINASMSVTGGSTNGVGVFTAACSGASDIAGNVAAPKSASFTVVYGFTGFSPPLGSGGDFKLGSTVPLRWQLQSANGTYVSSLNSVQSLRVAHQDACSGDAASPVDLGTSGNSGLRYDTTSNQFVFNWQTKGLQTGCYSLMLMLDDSTAHTATVILK